MYCDVKISMIRTCDKITGLFLCWFVDFICVEEKHYIAVRLKSENKDVFWVQIHECPEFSPWNGRPEPPHMHTVVHVGNCGCRNKVGRGRDLLVKKWLVSINWEGHGEPFPQGVRFGMK